MRQERTALCQLCFPDQTCQRVKRGGQRFLRHTAVQCSMEMRMELALLTRRRAGSDNAKLPRRKIELRSRQDLSVAISDHPAIERRMELANVLAKQLIRLAIY